MTIKFRVTIPILHELDLNEGAVAAAADQAARSKMRRRGLGRGENLVGAQAAATRAAEEETRRQLEQSSVGGVKQHHEDR